MRTFFNWEILNRIEESPKEYIIERNVELLGAFLFGYEDILLELKDKKELEEKYIKMPSLGDYGIKKFKAHNIGARNITSIISFISENELDFYNNYLSLLKAYEAKYPIEESICYVARQKGEFDHTKTSSYLEDSRPKPILSLSELFPHMKKRLPMYFGSYSLASLRAFLDGYFLCKKDYQIDLTPFEQKVKSFTKSIICESLEIENEFTTWDRKYRYDRDWKSWGDIDTVKEKNILESFWKDMDAFIGEKT
ncbi:hypothetical protein [Flavobacterium sp. UBA4854]|uniref:hypothetical protein n=1 Tax=Flavobacterium sp. UBA4854 TaxID=1946548 RepID=UPI00258002E9|nr:hypothetical protein [Flavobacterium sp. UBA4854]